MWRKTTFTSAQPANGCPTDTPMEEDGLPLTALLDQRLSGLCDQAALHHRQGAPDHPLGA